MLIVADLFPAAFNILFKMQLILINPLLINPFRYLHHTNAVV